MENQGYQNQGQGQGQGQGYQGRRNYDNYNNRRGGFNNRNNNRGGFNNRDNNDGNRRKNTPRPGEERPKKDAILDLNKYKDQRIRVKFQGGREVVGELKGFDQLMNLVLDKVKESLRDPDDENVLLDETRDLGMVVVRGPLLLSISPLDGSEVIDNPFTENQ